VVNHILTIYFFQKGCFTVRDMPTVAQTVAQIAKNRQWIRCRVVAKSAGSEDPVLTLMGALLYGPYSLKRPIFK
jgi:hypothetical protein